MSSRYQELYRLPNKLYVENSPVLIEAGALQKDTVSDKVLAQIKIRNLSTKDIIACKVAIKAYETNGNEVEGVSEFSYLDINISKGKEFGTKTPIYLPNNATRKFSVVVKEVVFEDNSIWTSNLIERTQIVAQKKITELFNNLEDIKQYQIEVGENCEFYPEKREGLFFCTCGATNLDTAAQCYHCGKKYDLLISCLNEELLTRKRNERLEKEKLEKEEANRLAEIEQKRKEEAARDFWAEYDRQQRENAYEQMKKRQTAAEKAQRNREIQQNNRRYGTDFDLRNPKDLEERRSRANFWSHNNNFRLLCDIIIGKNKKFSMLWDQFAKAKSEEERRIIVEKMEKMYPTREFAIRSVEKKTGYRK